jgi:hypothetical protein
MALPSVWLVGAPGHVAPRSPRLRSAGVAEEGRAEHSQQLSADQGILQCSGVEAGLSMRPANRCCTHTRTDVMRKASRCGGVWGLSGGSSAVANGLMRPSIAFCVRCRIAHIHHPPRCGDFMLLTLTRQKSFISFCGIVSCNVHPPVHGPPRYQGGCLAPGWGIWCAEIAVALDRTYMGTGTCARAHADTRAHTSSTTPTCQWQRENCL